MQSRPGFNSQHITALLQALTVNAPKNHVFIPSAGIGQLGWILFLYERFFWIESITKNADLVLITPEYHPKFTAKELVKLKQVNYKLLHFENAKYTMEALWLQFGLFHTHAGQGKERCC